MSTPVLKVQPRKAGYARATRRQGFVPAVVYGAGDDPVALKLAQSDVFRLFAQQGGRGLIELKPETGKSTTVMIRDVQRDPVRGDVLHIDFYRVNMAERIQTTVPLRLVGEDALGSSSAILQHQLREVEVSCLPGDIPEEIVIDVAGLEPGQAVTVEQLQAPQGVEILTSPQQVIASAVMPQAADLPEAETGDAEDGESAEAAGDDAAQDTP